MQRIQYDWNHDYLATPWEYPIDNNELHSTYDQFIQLRDTLIFSGKYYNDKAGAKLVVWASKETIEVMYRNWYVLRYQTPSDMNVEIYSAWPYVTRDQNQLSRFWPLHCVIQKDWRYRIAHKEEILLQSWQDKVYCYVDTYRKDSQWNYQLLFQWWSAVFDWEWAWWDCTLADLFKKMTAFGYMDRDLKAWDVLVLRMKDEEADAQWEPQWNDLTLQPVSNWWSVEYIDLPLNS